MQKPQTQWEIDGRIYRNAEIVAVFSDSGAFIGYATFISSNGIDAVIIWQDDDNRAFDTVPVRAISKD